MGTPRILEVLKISLNCSPVFEHSRISWLVRLVESNRSKLAKRPEPSAGTASSLAPEVDVPVHRSHAGQRLAPKDDCRKCAVLEVTRIPSFLAVRNQLMIRRRLAPKTDDL